jgi:hypothetical protein
MFVGERLPNDFASELFKMILEQFLLRNHSCGSGRPRPNFAQLLQIPEGSGRIEWGWRYPFRRWGVGRT